MKRSSPAAYVAKAIFLLGVIFSCSKNNELVIEFDVDHVEGKWIVESTTGPINLHSDNVFQLNDTIRFNRHTGFGDIFISRSGQNRYYDEILDIHYYIRLGFVTSEDKKTFEVVTDRAHYLDIIESRKDRLLLRYRDNGSDVSMKRIE